MNPYEEFLKEWTLTPEQKAEREALFRAYSAKRDPILAKLRAGEITRDQAVDLLTEVKGGGQLARDSSERLLARISLGVDFE